MTIAQTKLPGRKAAAWRFKTFTAGNGGIGFIKGLRPSVPLEAV